MWHGILGHDEVVTRFRHMLVSGRLASTFLFVGAPGIGKRMFALKLAQACLCETRGEHLLDPCEVCPACQQVLAGTHPDLEYLARPKDKSFIPIELLIGDREHRMQEGLCHRLGLKPFCGGRKIAILDDADDLNQEGANCLLKTLEEPPPNSVIILIGTSEQQQLPTIRSRCQIIRFRALPDDVVASLLLAQGHATNADDARRWAQLGTGSLQRALEFADPALTVFREDFLPRLAALTNNSIGLAAEVNSFVDEAGKDAPVRRARLRQVLCVALDFFRAALRRLDAGSLPVDGPLAAAIDQFLSSSSVNPEALASCLERCLEGEAQVDANANQATLIECWIDDLAKLLESEPPRPRQARLVSRV